MHDAVSAGIDSYGDHHQSRSRERILNLQTAECHPDDLAGLMDSELSQSYMDGSNFQNNQ